MVVVGRATSSVTTPFDRIAQHKNDDADGAKEAVQAALRLNEFNDLAMQLADQMG